VNLGPDAVALLFDDDVDGIILDCFGDDTSGKSVLAASVKLTTARVTSIDFEMPDVRDTNAGPYGERIGLTFEQIDIDERASNFNDHFSG
jgi:hypothetical protein